MMSEVDIRYAVSGVKELAEACEQAQRDPKALQSLAEDVVEAHVNDDPDALQKAISAMRKELP